MNDKAEKSGTFPLCDIARQVAEINRANGWNVLEPHQWQDPYKVPAILALIMSEAAEALEEFRADRIDGFATELADVVIRVLDCAHGLGINIDMAVAAKLEKNKHRGFRHGGKRV